MHMPPENRRFESAKLEEVPGASGNGQTDVGKIGNLCTFLDGLPYAPASAGPFFSERRRPVARSPFFPALNHP
jgi:hypothetical protein